MCDTHVFAQSTKIGTHENNAIHSISVYIYACLDDTLVLQYSEMDMWQYLYGIGYGLIPNAKLCKQLWY